jgi:hypothetical protein
MAGLYDALIAGWDLSSATAGALPPGVTGTSLFGLSTAAKTAAVIAWTIVGQVPVTTTVEGYQLANCINWAEFNALTQSEQTNLLQVCAITGPLQGGLLGATLLTAGMFLDYFSHTGPTIKALTALVEAAPELWWSAPSITGPSGGAGILAPTSQAAAVVAAAGLS